MRVILTGNYLLKVSCQSWHRCILYRQETASEWFPERYDAAANPRSKKLPVTIKKRLPKGKRFGAANYFSTPISL
jgi:hypothetical protein